MVWYIDYCVWYLSLIKNRKRWYLLNIGWSLLSFYLSLNIFKSCCYFLFLSLRNLVIDFAFYWNFIMCILLIYLILLLINLFNNWNFLINLFRLIINVFLDLNFFIAFLITAAALFLLWYYLNSNSFNWISCYYFKYILWFPNW